MADQPHLDWSSAEVRDGALTVSVTGETDDEWEQTFARTLALLSSGGSWREVGFKKGTVTVEGVSEGDEPNLRFALDGAVQEANAHHAEDEDEDDESDGDDDDGSDGDGAGETDRRMTERFRGSDATDD